MPAVLSRFLRQAPRLICFLIAALASAAHLQAQGGYATGAPMSVSTYLPQGSSHIEYKKVHRFVITYDYSTYWPSGGPHSARIYLPVPPETGNQHISSFHTNVSGDSSSDRSQRRVIAAVVHKDFGDEREFRWRVQVVGTFRQRMLVSGPATGYPTGNSPTRDDLRETDSINWDTATFQDWLNETGLRRTARETNLVYARRLFNYLESHGRYIYPPLTPWNASQTCNRLGTDCGGFSLVFTAACRANHVPAHLLVGQWFKTQEYGDEVVLNGRQPHVYAEFYDPQIGWIPADLSSAIMHVPGYSFGQDPVYFLVLHLDTDFHFNTPENPNELVRWIQNPSPWFSSSASYAAEVSRHSWAIQAD
jgi:transglutaminase-like putative cysteine protease